MSRRRALSAATALVLVSAAVLVQAQTRFSYSSGQPLEPAYEGWMRSADGSYTLYFGYMNSNWLQEIDIPIGPNNSFDGPNADLGQPTHFYPRRNPFLFTVHVPADFGKKELIWTLTANGHTRKAFASLKTDYEIDPQVISTEVGGDNGNLADALRTNLAPELTVEGEKTRQVKVNQPLSISVVAGDPDGIPARRDGKRQPGLKVAPKDVPTAAASRRNAPAAAPNSAAAVYTPPVSTVASSGPGLRFSWSVYRGKASAVRFAPDQMKTWMDTRAYANSPWSPPYAIPEPPPDGRWTATVTFAEPGTYVMRGVASDSSLFTYENLTVVVGR